MERLISRRTVTGFSGAVFIQLHTIYCGDILLFYYRIVAGVIYRVPTSQDIIIDQLEAEIQSLKLQQLTGKDECMEMVKNLMDEIRGLKKNLSVVESILRSSLPIVDIDHLVD